MTPSPSNQPSAMIAGGGFAVMAWNEAIRRTYPAPIYPAPTLQYVLANPPQRMTKRCDGADEFCEHCEYQNMLDRAWEGELARRAAAKLGMLGDNFTVKL